MLANSRYLAVAMLIVSAAVPARDLQADVGDCVAPALPTLPAGLANDVDADRVSAAVEAAMSASFEYLACVDKALEQGNAGRSDQERRQLERSIEHRLTELQALAERWNGMYSLYALQKLSE